MRKRLFQLARALNERQTPCAAHVCAARFEARDCVAALPGTSARFPATSTLTGITRLLSASIQRGPQRTARPSCCRIWLRAIGCSTLGVARARSLLDSRSGSAPRASIAKFSVPERAVGCGAASGGCGDVLGAASAPAVARKSRQRRRQAKRCQEAQEAAPHLLENGPILGYSTRSGSSSRLRARE